MCILGYVEFYIEQSTFFRSLKEHPEHETFRPFMLRESKYYNQGWSWAIFEDHL